MSPNKSVRVAQKLPAPQEGESVWFVGGKAYRSSELVGYKAIKLDDHPASPTRTPEEVTKTETSAELFLKILGIKKDHTMDPLERASRGIGMIYFQKDLLFY